MSTRHHGRGDEPRRHDPPPPYARGDEPRRHDPPPPYARGDEPRRHDLLPYARGDEPRRHALLKESRDPGYGIGPGGKSPPHLAILEEHLAVQHDDIQGLLVDNQRFAATHVALRQDLEAAQFDLHRTHKYAGEFHAEKDMEMRDLHEKLMKAELELRGVDGKRNELRMVGADINKLTGLKQELVAQAQAMNEDLTRMTSDLHQVPAIRSEIEGLKQELQQARAAIEYEKKGYAQNYEHGQLIENKLLSTARELEKLRSELANAEKGAHPAAAYGYQGSGYNASYQNSEAAYAGNQYPTSNYGSNPINLTNPTRPAQANLEGYHQYGADVEGYHPYGAAHGAYET